ncbi:MAG: phosphotransferase family protein [Acidimicrobiia bacterium]
MTDEDETVAAGIRDATVTAWLSEHVPGATAPFAFELIAGGHSNLTFAVTDTNGRRLVLRRPPLGQVLATAHDMGREHAIIAALGQTAVPVPHTYGLCTDESVNGAPFYVMDYVAGHVLRQPEEVVATLSPRARHRAGESVADVLAAIHSVDPDAVGLGALGRKEGYVARQLKRWYGQFQQSNERTGRPVPDVHDVHARLSSRIPDQGPATIVHGDYRLDNCMFDREGTVVAVLDWELCTLGDPMADVGLLMVYWGEPTDEYQALLTAPTTAPDFPIRKELLARYEERSSRDLSQLDFYTALAYWKLACILEGVYARYAAGDMGGAPEGFEAFERLVVRLAGSARDIADQIG